MRNLRGKGFEHYPPIFGTTARTGFLCAIAARSEALATLPTRLSMEFRHVRTLAAWFSRLGVCRPTDNGIYSLDPSFGPYAPLSQYLESLNAQVGEWESLSTEIDEPPLQKPVSRRTIEELFGTAARAAVLMTLASFGFGETEQIAATEANLTQQSLRKATHDLIRSRVVQKLAPAEETLFVLEEHPSTPALRSLLRFCAVQIQGNDDF